MTTTSATVVHHLYRDPAHDLLPACGAIPGPDKTRGDWNAGHDLELLLECLSYGLCCCATCLSVEVLGGWSPLIPDHEIADDEDVL